VNETSKFKATDNVVNI